jgi:hypothetical protein
MATSLARRWQRLLELSPVCSGSLHEQHLTCGKAGCGCHDLKEPRLHGPYYLWRRHIAGKDRTLVFSFISCFSLFLREEHRLNEVIMNIEARASRPSRTERLSRFVVSFALESQVSRQAGCLRSQGSRIKKPLTHGP